MKIFFTVCALSTSLIFGQVPSFLNKFKQAAETVKQQAEEVTGKVTPSTAPSNKTSAKTEQPADPNKIQETSIKAAAAEFDIRGLKMDMTIEEFRKIIVNDFQVSGQWAIMQPDHEFFDRGDRYFTTKEFEFFGDKLSHFVAFFDDGKLKRLELGIIYEEGDGESEVPSVMKALSDKFGSQPTIVREALAMTGHFRQDAIIQDTKGATIRCNCEVEKDMSGTIFNNVFVFFTSPHYEEYVAARNKMIQDLGKQQEEAAKKKAKSQI